MTRENKKEIALKRRHKRVRKKIIGTAEKPRCSVHRSHLNLYVQLIDDLKGATIVSVSTRDKEFKEKSSQGSDCKAAELLGQILSEKAKTKGIQKVVFDRGGYPYHGRIKALAESTRKHGLIF